MLAKLTCLMSVIARWHVTAVFGRKPELIAAVQSWIVSVAAKAGCSKENTRLLTGSVGAPESELQMEITFNSIAELDDFFKAIASQGPEHAKFQEQASPVVVHGSNRWEVLRIVPLF